MMKIRLKDKTPVQKSYYFMPKSLLQEVKHVEDLLNKGWTTKSSSNYLSPVMAQVVLRLQSFKQQDHIRETSITKSSRCH